MDVTVNELYEKVGRCPSGTTVVASDLTPIDTVELVQIAGHWFLVLGDRHHEEDSSRDPVGGDPASA